MRTSGLYGEILLLLVLVAIYSSTVQSVPTEADRKCPPIIPGGGSPLFPQKTKGANVTMYRVFNTVGNPPEVNITWVREPSTLSLSNGRYHINKTLSNGTVRAAITVWDLKLFPDVGKYTVTVCSNCTCNTTTFVLQLFKCDPTLLPQPVDQYRNINITESYSKVLHLYTVFNGSTNTFFYPTDWTHNGRDLCTEGTTEQSAVFTCNRTILGDCLFWANLYINDYTIKNSGNYTVQAIGSGSASRSSTIHVDISRKPWIKFCTPGQLTGDNDVENSRFSCQISNYSDYVHVVVVENNRREYNESTQNLSFSCEAHAQDRLQATCTVTISPSAHSGKRDYQLCAGYNDSVASTTPKFHCSDRITLIPGNSTRVLLGMVAEIALVILLLLALLLALSMRLTAAAHRKDRIEAPSETTPLFKKGEELHEIYDKERVSCSSQEGQHSETEERVPGSSPKLPAGHECSDGCPKTASPPNSSIQETGLWEIVNSGGVLGHEWEHNARGVDPHNYEQTHSQESSEATAVAIRHSLPTYHGKIVSTTH